MTEEEQRSKAIEQLQSQIDIIKSYAKDIDESQGLIANCITILTAHQMAQAIFQNLQQIDQKLGLLIENKTPSIYVP